MSDDLEIHPHLRLTLPEWKSFMDACNTKKERPKLKQLFNRARYKCSSCGSEITEHYIKKSSSVGPSELSYRIHCKNCVKV